MEEIGENVFHAQIMEDERNLTHEIRLSGLSSGDKTIGDTFVYEYTRPSHASCRVFVGLNICRLFFQKEFYPVCACLAISGL